MINLLIVDDSIFMRRYLKEMLIDECNEGLISSQLNFFEAEGKHSAISIINSTKIDVILMDIMMKNSVLEGMEIIDEIRGDFDIKKIIVVSSSNQSFLLNKCREVGIMNYLQKPVSKRHLAELLNKSLLC